MGLEIFRPNLCVEIRTVLLYFLMRLNLYLSSYRTKFLMKFPMLIYQNYLFFYMDIQTHKTFSDAF